MRENNEKFRRETDAAFAFATILLNLLILLILGATLWSAQIIWTQNALLKALFLDYPMF